MNLSQSSLFRGMSHRFSIFREFKKFLPKFLKGRHFFKKVMSLIMQAPNGYGFKNVKMPVDSVNVGKTMEEADGPEGW